ncbi:HNH endonuclease [Streptomyces sp. TLI_053]|uniref:HNH endonuclease signature motif containing protein n=1 Tax=Streptomyces sp. TLI_053 TaxID=1855352 RepID=UPI00087AD873|nr:HNH endonuclease signature motif containing protein [Streptomyces sp. TLI_053]SDS54991.1 HNH endonuclease [Streptomyces sp. TLI_053]
MIEDRPTDVEEDDFLEFVGDYTSVWASDRRSVVLRRTRWFTVLVSLHRGSRPRVTLTLTGPYWAPGDGKRRAEVLSGLRREQDDLLDILGPGCEVRFDRQRSAVSVTADVPVRWESNGCPPAEHLASRSRARKWIVRADELLVHGARLGLGRRPAEPEPGRARTLPPRPVPARSVPQPRLKGEPVVEWPIPLTAARAQDSPPSRESVGRSVPTLPPLPPAVPGPARAEPAPPVAERAGRICPVCGERLTTPGRSRHQRCEGRALTVDAAVRRAAPQPAEPRPAAREPATAEAVERYRTLVADVERREAALPGRRRDAVSRNPVRIPQAREAVLLRCQGFCENPGCGGQPVDCTDDGRAILEVDHVRRLAEGGRDHPSQMVALCPNCHAMKERGSCREELVRVLLVVAREAHGRWLPGQGACAGR